MPSSPGYVRDYKQEKLTAERRGETGGPNNKTSRNSNAERTKARRLAIKKGMVARGDGKDVHHKKPLSKGGTTTPANLAVTSPKKNRGYPRKSDGSIK